MTRFTIIAPFPPEAKHGGAALLRGLFQNLPSIVELSWQSLIGSSTLHWKAEIPRLNGSFFFRALHSYRLAGVRYHLNKIITFFELVFFGPYFLKKLKSLNPDFLIIYCHPHFFHIYEYIINKSKLPYHLTIHDDPVVATFLNSSIGLKANETEKRFKKLIKNAISVDVITKRMAQNYHEKYYVNCAVITNGWDYVEKRPRTITSTEIQIISTGNSWSTELKDLKDDNVQYFLEAINKNNSNILFHIITPWFPYEKNYSFVKRWNFLKDNEFDELMSSSHIGYAYDPFLKSTEEFTKFSFPSKIIGYLCKGMPFIYHGPRGSTVEDLIKEYDAGIVITSNDEAEIMTTIQKIANNYEHYCREATRAWKERFDSKTIQNEYWNNIFKNYSHLS